MSLKHKHKHRIIFSQPRNRLIEYEYYLKMEVLIEEIGMDFKHLVIDLPERAFVYNLLEELIKNTLIHMSSFKLWLTKLLVRIREKQILMFSYIGFRGLKILSYFLL